MTILDAVQIFFSGKKLIFGNDKHIEARNILRRLRKKTKDYVEYEHCLKVYGIHSNRMVPIIPVVCW